MFVDYIANAWGRPILDSALLGLGVQFDDSNDTPTRIQYGIINASLAVPFGEIYDA